MEYKKYIIMEHSWNIRDIPFGDVKTEHGKSLHIPPIPRSTHCWSYGGVIVAVAPLMRMMSQCGNPALGDDGELSHESQAWEAAEADASAVLAGSCEDGDFFSPLDMNRPDLEMRSLYFPIEY